MKINYFGFTYSGQSIVDCYFMLFWLKAIEIKYVQIIKEKNIADILQS